MLFSTRRGASPWAVSESGTGGMVLMTMIARVFDGLPLAASVQEDEQTGK